MVSKIQESERELVMKLGERKKKTIWSEPVYWQTEPIQTIGQWAPIAGTVLAIIGSFYLPVAQRLDREKAKVESPGDIESTPRTSDGGHSPMDSRRNRHARS